MPYSTLTLAANDNARLAVHHWPSALPARANVVICHGMAEHGARYQPLAAQMNTRGLNVWALDLRGHGASTPDLPRGQLANGTGWSSLVADLLLVIKHARESAPALPLVLLGHSMGTFVVQSLLLDHSDAVDVAVLSGSNANPAPLCRIGRQLARLESLLRGRDAPALTMNTLSFGRFNRAFGEARTEFDWLSRDPEQVDLYVEDPLCGFVLSGHYWQCLFGALTVIADPRQLGRIRADLPVMVLGGDRDPVSAGGGLAKLQQRLHSAGLSQVELRLYPGARHEAFNETNRDEVIADLLDWLESRLTTTPQRSSSHAEA
ncbi:MAG: alpha/beta hydrolase [Pseudomonadaceae bacterium]